MELPDKKEHLWSSWGDNGPHRETDKRRNNASESRTWKRYRNRVEAIWGLPHTPLCPSRYGRWRWPTSPPLGDSLQPWRSGTTASPRSASNCLDPFLYKKPSKIDSEKFENRRIFFDFVVMGFEESLAASYWFSSLVFFFSEFLSFSFKLSGGLNQFSRQGFFGFM